MRAIHADQELRLQDLEKRYRLVIEITLTQLALVSYLKAAVPLRLQQGKEIRSAWLSGIHSSGMVISPKYNLLFDRPQFGFILRNLEVKVINEGIFNSDAATCANLHNL